MSGSKDRKILKDNNNPFIACLLCAGYLLSNNSAFTTTNVLYTTTLSTLQMGRLSLRETGVSRAPDKSQMIKLPWPVLNQSILVRMSGPCTSGMHFPAPQSWQTGICIIWRQGQGRGEETLPVHLNFGNFQFSPTNSALTPHSHIKWETEKGERKKKPNQWAWLLDYRTLYVGEVSHVTQTLICTFNHKMASTV